MENKKLRKANRASASIVEDHAFVEDPVDDGVLVDEVEAPAAASNKRSKKRKAETDPEDEGVARSSETPKRKLSSARSRMKQYKAMVADVTKHRSKTFTPKQPFDRHIKLISKSITPDRLVHNKLDLQNVRFASSAIAAMHAYTISKMIEIVRSARKDAQNSGHRTVSGVNLLAAAERLRLTPLC